MKRFAIYNKNNYNEPITMSYFEDYDQAYEFYKQLKRFSTLDFDKLFTIKEFK